MLFSLNIYLVFDSATGYFLVTHDARLMNDIQPGILIFLFSFLFFPTDGLDEKSIGFTATARRLIATEACSECVVCDAESTVRD